MLRLSQIGYAGAAPEMRYTAGGEPVASVRVGTTDRWTADGEVKERTTWIRWECWGKSAENLAKLVKKGSMVFIEGTVRNDSWEDKDGNKQYRDKHVVGFWRLLDRKDSGSPAEGRSVEDGPGTGAADAFQGGVPEGFGPGTGG